MQKCTQKDEQSFLDVIGIPQENRQFTVPMTRYQVDGIDRNTLYEFLGDYWHGNPKKYQKDQTIGKFSKTTFGFLYNRTIKRFNRLKNLGYNIKYVWESDWKIWNKNKEKNLPILEYKK